MTAADEEPLPDMHVFLETDRLILRRFTELGVPRVIARTMAVNTASRRVMEKAGLTLARTFEESWAHPIPGAEGDHTPVT
ncbi:MAG TPA: GNAT family N-acetyltransferase [Actinomadura sp.]|nr:GNAT family N-acetyltransferase [Actinomadura sp.]